MTRHTPYGNCFRNLTYTNDLVTYTVATTVPVTMSHRYCTSVANMKQRILQDIEYTPYYPVRSADETALNVHV